MTADTLRTDRRTTADAGTQTDTKTGRHLAHDPRQRESRRKGRRSEAKECTAHIAHAPQDAHRSHRTHGESRTPSNHDEIAPR